MVAAALVAIAIAIANVAPDIRRSCRAETESKESPRPREGWRVRKQARPAACAFFFDAHFWKKDARVATRLHPPPAPQRRGMRRRAALAASLALAHALHIPPDASIGAALRAATSAFTDGSVPEAAVSAEHLLAHAAGLGSNRAALSLHREEALSEASRDAFERMCARRLEREPVQYILGEWDFLELTLSLRPPVLIPRPETEELVEHVLRAHPTSQRFLDVGCGSGAIGLALIHRLAHASCVGVDVSEAATVLAAENAQRCGLSDRYEAQLVEGGIAAFGSVERLPPPSFDVIVSNPPYIPRADMAALEPEVAGHEDDQALCGGLDGLDVVKDVLRAAPMLLAPSGPRAVWLEVDTSHPPLIDAWVRAPAQAALRLEVAASLADLYGRDRFVEIRWSGPLYE